MKYGFNVVGFHTVIGLRMMITATDRAFLQKLYKDKLVIRETRKGYTMIEGCLLNSEVGHFMDQYHGAILRYKCVKAEYEYAKYRERLAPHGGDEVAPNEVNFDEL